MCLLLARRHEEQHVQQGDRLPRRQFGTAQITGAKLDAGV